MILVSGKQSREEKIEVALGDNNGWWDQQTVQIIDKFNRGTWGIRDACILNVLTYLYPTRRLKAYARLC